MYDIRTLGLPRTDPHEDKTLGQTLAEITEEIHSYSLPHTHIHKHPKTPKPVIRGYPPFRGSGFSSQSNRKYQMMPITTSHPKSDPDSRRIFGRVLAQFAVTDIRQGSFTTPHN